MAVIVTALQGQIRLPRKAGSFPPQLSPDGQWVAFSCQPQAHVYDIGIIKADGTGFAQLTSAAGDDNSPRWTRDGRIVFTSERDGNR